MTERYNPYTDLGNSSPDEAEDLYVERLNRQQIDKVTDKKRREANRSHRRRSSVRDFESDRDHIDAMAEIPLGFVDESEDDLHADLPPGTGKLLARVIARRALMQGIINDTEDDEAQRRARIRAFNDTHPDISI